MVKDRRTGSTLAYLLTMLPNGVAYFVTAVVGLSASLACLLAPLLSLAGQHRWSS